MILCSTTHRILAQLAQYQGKGICVRATSGITRSKKGASVANANSQPPTTSSENTLPGPFELPDKPAFLIDEYLRSITGESKPKSLQKDDSQAALEATKKLGLSSYRAIVYTEDELKKCDLSKPPSPENPHPFNPAHIPPTYSRSIAPYVNTSNCLQALVELGVDLFEVDTSNPTLTKRLVRLDLEKDVKPRLQWLVNEVGFEPSQLGEYLTRNPFFLLQELDDMRARVGYLDSKGFSKEEIVKIVDGCRFWVNFDVETIDHRLGWLHRELKLTAPQIRALISLEPRLIQFGVGQLERISKLLGKELNFRAEQVKRMLIKDPRVFLMNAKTLTETFIYVNRIMRLSKDLISKNPLILRCHLSAIRNRHEFLKKLGRASYEDIEALVPRPHEPSSQLEASRESPAEKSNELIPVVEMALFLHPSDEIFARKAARTYLEVYNDFLRTH
ncbi:unnamed protein product, partial [Mesorhabditis spiculigera]